MSSYPKNPIHDVISVANAVMDIIREKNDRSVTPLKLMRLLYEMQGFSLAVDAGPLFHESIHALECPDIMIDPIWNAFVAMVNHDRRQDLILCDEEEFYLSPLYASKYNIDNNETFSRVYSCKSANSKNLFPIAQLKDRHISVVEKVLDRYKDFDHHELSQYIKNRENSAAKKAVQRWGYGTQIDLSDMYDEFLPAVKITSKP